MVLVGSSDQAKSMYASYQNVARKANFLLRLPVKEMLSAPDEALGIRNLKTFKL
jgi:hypothetical protein